MKHIWFVFLMCQKKEYLLQILLYLMGFIF